MDTLQQLLIEPLAWPFMRQAMLAAVIVGVLSGVMGVYVVTRGMAFLGDALAHSVLPGVAAVFIAGQTGQSALLLGGMVAGILSALGIGFLTRGRRLHEDTAIGIVFAGTLALGIALISSTRSFATDLQHILIGDILAVRPDDLMVMAIIGAGVLVIVLLIYKEMLLVSFDPILARTLRMPGEALRMLLLVLLAVTIVIGVQAVGVVMIAATLVTPAATARLLTHRLRWMMVLSALIASGSGIIGMYVSWHLEIVPSASIVLIMTLVFLLTFFLAPRQGYLWSLLGMTARRA